MLQGLPEPLPNEDTAQFWDACYEGRLTAQQCPACDAFRWPPGPVCPECGDIGGEWVELTGIGSLYSWVVVEVPLAPGLEDQVPYVVGLVEVAEGPRIVSTISAVEVADLRAGMPLKVEFGRTEKAVFTFIPG